MIKIAKINTALLILILTSCTMQSSTEMIAKQSAAKARVELALGYLNQQNVEQAKINLDRAEQHAPEYYLVHSAYAYFYQSQNNPQQAQNAYERALKLDKTQGDVHNNFATFLCSQQRFEQAFDEFNQALNSPKYYNQANTFENMAICALMAKDQTIYEQALQDLTKLDNEKAENLKRLNMLDRKN